MYFIMKKQQILFIDGWEPAENFSSYIEELKKLEINNPFEVKRRWKLTLQKWLWDNYNLVFSETPNDFYAEYDKWRIMFEKYLPYLDDEIILIGHSLWSTFIAKYLNENSFPVTIKKILLVAPAFEDSEDEVLWSFNFDKRLDVFKKYSDKVRMYYSLDDFVVPVSDFESFKRVLWDIEFREFIDRWHFLQEEFLEIIEDIKKID